MSIVGKCVLCVIAFSIPLSPVVKLQETHTLLIESFTTLEAPRLVCQRGTLPSRLFLQLKKFIDACQ